MKNKTLCKILTLLIPIAAIFIVFLRNILIALSAYFPRCAFYSVYHLYCPSCGNTRSVIALLHGDLFASLRFNIVILILVVISLLGYIELAAYSFWRPLRLLPRKLSFYLVLIALLCAYWIIRNFIPYLTPRVFILK